MQYLVVHYFCFENGRRGWMELRPNFQANKMIHDISDLFVANRYSDDQAGLAQAHKDIEKFCDITELPVENFQVKRVKLEIEDIEIMKQGQ